MSSSHKKKRNTGLLYEFLVRSISKSLIENDKKLSSKALKLIKRHFKPGTELYREFRLINSLMKTTIQAPSTAASIIKEARTHAMTIDAKKLDREKSLLIRNINYGVNDDHFYDQHVDDYRMYATIDSMIGEWRNPSCDLQKLAEHEDSVLSWLLSEKKQAADAGISSTTQGSGRLLMKVMMSKLNEKYSTSLNKQQKELLKAYAYSAVNDDPATIENKLHEIKQSLISAIDEYSGDTSCPEYVGSKLNSVKDNLLNESNHSVNDDMVSRYMLYIKLIDEIMSPDDEGGKLT
jgi:hypothetical protein